MKTKNVTFLLLVMIVSIIPSGLKAQEFYDKLQTYVSSLSKEFEQIDKKRKKDLEKIGDYMFDVWNKSQVVRPLFVCTHNSRRSQMAQAWMLTAAYYYGVTNISPSSGGTESTAFNKRAVAALERAGFKIIKGENNPDNPTYILMTSNTHTPVSMFSKKYGDTFNPQKDFFAVMVCSDADNSCPVVKGADKRFSLPYKDPRYSDKTASEATTYDKRCRQIAREMFFIMHHMKEQIVELQESKK